MKAKVIVIVYLLFTVLSCATTFPSVESEREKSFDPTMSLVHFYRKSNWFASIFMGSNEISMDGKYIGRFTPRDSKTISIEPGKHQFILSADGERKDSIKINAEGGKEYYIVIKTYKIELYEDQQ